MGCLMVYFGFSLLSCWPEYCGSLNHVLCVSITKQRAKPQCDFIVDKSISCGLILTTSLLWKTLIYDRSIGIIS